MQQHNFLSECSIILGFPLMNAPKAIGTCIIVTICANHIINWYKENYSQTKKKKKNWYKENDNSKSKAVKIGILRKIAGGTSWIVRSYLFVRKSVKTH